MSALAATHLAFTDELLDPERTTRLAGVTPEPVYLLVGDEILVDCSPYGLLGLQWCRVRWLAPGSAAVYPYKADIPGLGVGQWKASEIHAWLRPLAVHQARRERA